MMKMFGARWQRKQQITVVHATNRLPEISLATAHRRLKELQKKDWIALEVDKADNRVRFVVPTVQAIKYFSELGRCQVRAVQR
jgi:DNA-binding MarR family transcriptional regulator